MHITCLVHRITNAIFEIGFVTAEDLNPSKRAGGNNVVA